MPATQAIDALCVNTLRTLSIDAIQQAGSGHPGLPLGAAPMAYVLWQRFLRHDPRDPGWPNRDRFVLSAGHGSALLYSLLHLTGYDLPLDEIKRFRQLGSRTPGHPEFGHTVGVEATTGPLGQGCSNAVGMAIAERFLAQRYNRGEHVVVDHHTYALVGDGDLMEGIASEAASLAGHLGLGKLIWLYDSNDISLDGPTSLSFTEDVPARFRAYGWQVLEVADGDTDLEAIGAAIDAARADTAHPSLIVVKTTIGYGSPKKAGTAGAHGSPLGAEEILATKRALGWESTEPFFIPDDAREHLRAAVGRGAQERSDWSERFERWAAAHPNLAAQWQLAQSELLPEGWDQDLPQFEVGTKPATREAGGVVLNALAERLPWLLGGDADLSGSTKTSIKSSGDFDGRDGAEPGRNIRYGVREHAMAAAANGMAYHGGCRTFTATFFCFADYMRPALRLAAMNDLPVINVFTHDSIAVGEDGPTHQPVEHLMSLRVIPGLHVVRPADADETREAWRHALLRSEGPTAIVLTRQGILVRDRADLAPASGLERGGYVLRQASAASAAVVLVATGSEVELALDSAAALEAAGHPTRVVSLPCWEVFADQDPAYRAEVLGGGGLRVSIEAGSTLGWERWIGEDGLAIGIDRFGASAPGDELMAEYGLTPPQVVERVERHLAAR
ncbi:transketolase [Engelhardtia mirabilis]|uniref:Transketolase n=1 Tax=Engelhardtia mirabilis TaxID=2528011 RepID=A0A518BPS7_9BACT|nr:Transketolase [Planctomycetes bacterium Pla133]QDV03293.1 Transketolase [Planctomycetes bacterium Pla86]